MSKFGAQVNQGKFLYVDDIARACIHVMNLEQKIYNKNTSKMCGHLNVGSGEDITIKLQKQ